MSKDIALQELGNIDYIPEDDILCGRCIYFEECPYTYDCPTLKRLIKFDEENREL